MFSQKIILHTGSLQKLPVDVHVRVHRKCIQQFLWTSKVCYFLRKQIEKCHLLLGLEYGMTMQKIFSSGKGW